MGKSSNKQPQHLLIVRLSAMGDVAMVVHAVRALRVKYPSLKISILTRPLFQPLFEGLGVSFVDLDLKGRHKGLCGIRRLAGDIAKLGVDTVADMHGVLRSTTLRIILKLFYGINAKKIMKGKVSKWMRMDGGCKEATVPLIHTVTRYCDLLRRLGFEIEDPTAAQKRTPLNPNPIAQPKTGEWVGIAPFSAHQGKSYPLNNVRSVVDLLSSRYERVFIHSGGGKELGFAKEMQSLYANVSAVYGSMSLAEEIDLIANLDCIISMDSFAMHVASLTATPVVSIWGATHPSLGFSGYGCDPEGYLQIDMQCRPCSTFGDKPCRFGDYRCLNDIDPKDVADRVGVMISKKTTL